MVGLVRWLCHLLRRGGVALTRHPFWDNFWHNFRGRAAAECRALAREYAGSQRLGRGGPLGGPHLRALRDWLEAAELTDPEDVPPVFEPDPSTGELRARQPDLRPLSKARRVLARRPSDEWIVLLVKRNLCHSRRIRTRLRAFAQTSLNTLGDFANLCRRRGAIGSFAHRHHSAGIVHH
jgi:hypothetical protein